LPDRLGRVRRVGGAEAIELVALELVFDVVEGGSESDFSIDSSDSSLSIFLLLSTRFINPIIAFSN
jgi:hypothetical protein